jgi:hypothetical protein
MSAFDELEARRAFECRLTADRALETLEEAEAWAHDRGLLIRTPDCALPSLHVACHEEPYAPDKPGFGQYPKTKWWWGWALAERPGLRWLRIRSGKNVLVTDAVAALVDPLAREELEDAARGARGEPARRLVEHLAAAGPSFAEELKEELGLDTRALRAAREPLERVGAVVARQVLLETAGGGERYATELARWDQLGLPQGPGGLAALLLAGVRAAVLGPEDEARRWFTWRVSAADVDRLVEEGRLGRVDGYLVSPASGS